MVRIALFSLFILQGCSDDGSSCSDNLLENDAKFSQLNGNSFIFSVDRISEFPDVQFPFDELQEDDYTATAESKQYEISFSEDLQTVTIMSDVLISGEIEEDDSQHIEYSLTTGFGAGGRFIVWIEDKNFEAELTVYGSGIPIIQSERGILKPLI